MAYKISGDVSEPSKVYVIDEATDTLEGYTTVSGSEYEITGLGGGNKIVIAKDNAGNVLGYSTVTPILYQTLDRLDSEVNTSGWTITGLVWNNNLWYAGDTNTGKATSISFEMPTGAKWLRYNKRNKQGPGSVHIVRTSDDVDLMSSYTSWNDVVTHTTEDDISGNDGETIYIEFRKLSTGGETRAGISNIRIENSNGDVLLPFD